MPDNFDLYYALICVIRKYAEVASYESSCKNDTMKQHEHMLCLLLNYKQADDATECLLYTIENGYFYPLIINILVSQYNADPNEAFEKLTDYVLTQKNADKENVKNVIYILKQSPSFNKETNGKMLTKHVERINTLRALITK